MKSCVSSYPNGNQEKKLANRIGEEEMGIAARMIGDKKYNLEDFSQAETELNKVSSREHLHICTWSLTQRLWSLK